MPPWGCVVASCGCCMVFCGCCTRQLWLLCCSLRVACSLLRTYGCSVRQAVAQKPRNFKQLKQKYVPAEVSWVVSLNIVSLT